MLEELVVEGLGAIERTELHLGTGLNALTGETGAGKTLLVAALGLLKGDRADRSRVREGVAEAVVEGRFVIPEGHEAADLLAEHGLLDVDGTGEIVVTRTVPADGRAARARVNGRMVTASVLSAIGESLVEIAGQHQHQTLGRPAVQREMLDAFAGKEAISLASEVRAAVRAVAVTERELVEIGSSEREREREVDVLRYEIDEISKVAPEPRESIELKGTATRLENAASIARSVESARNALSTEGGAIDAVAAASDRMAAAIEMDPSLGELAKRLEALGYELSDIAAGLAAVDIESDPEELERLHDRLAELGRLRRKYGDSEAAVLEYLDTARERLASLEEQRGSVEGLKERLQVERKQALDRAGRLSELRNDAARSLEREIVPLLAELGLPHARFEVALEPCDLYEGGGERIEFRVAANPGETPKALAKVASGGELSRVALALHVLTGAAATPTVVFDEVDAGVGGEAAQAVGRSLARLASDRSAQVLVVTHLPQVAAWADEQYRVAKSITDGRSDVDVERVEGPDRVEELSRMLAGMPESESARQHAEELLEIAGRER